MRKFKPNMLTTFMFAMIEMLAPFCVGTPVMILLIGNDNYTTNEILSIFPFFIITLIFIIVFCCILNLITLPFTKYSVFLYDDYFSRGMTKVKYEDVTRIEIDSGIISRTGGGAPCCLDCYSDNALLISIEHPSLLMSFLVCMRCKNAKLKYTRIKKVALLWVIALAMCIILGLYGAS